MQKNFTTPIYLLRIILHHLVAIVAIQDNNSEFTRLLNLQNCKLVNSGIISFIPVKQIRSSNQLLYVSAIPHVLARQSDSKAISIAHILLEQITKLQVISVFNGSDILLPTELMSGFTASHTTTGELRFEFHDAAIAYWLNQLLHVCFIQSTVQPASDLQDQSQRLFAIHHAHARCCTLLRHAHQSGFIQLAAIADPKHWSITTPTSIAWLDATQQLRLPHPSERRLVLQLLAALDTWAESPSKPGKQYFFHAESISRAVQDVHRSCQLFGQLLTEPRDRLHAHLALILSTQRVLLQLLEGLGLVAVFRL